MSYKEEPIMNEDLLRKKSTAAPVSSRNVATAIATPAAIRTPIEIDKAALGYEGLRHQNEEDVAFVDGGDQSVNILNANGFNGEQTQSILLAKDDLMEEDERARVQPKKETG